VPDQQQPAILADARERRARVRSIETPRQRCVRAQPPALLLAPGRRGELGGLVGAHLGAEQHLIEARAQPRQRDTCSARLGLPAFGQASLRIDASPVRLGLRVPE